MKQGVIRARVGREDILVRSESPVSFLVYRRSTGTAVSADGRFLLALSEYIDGGRIASFRDYFQTRLRVLGLEMPPEVAR
jgi:hypothetical protein